MKRIVCACAPSQHGFQISCRSVSKEESEVSKAGCINPSPSPTTKNLQRHNDNHNSRCMDQTTIQGILTTNHSHCCKQQVRYRRSWLCVGGRHSSDFWEWIDLLSSGWKNSRLSRRGRWLTRVGTKRSVGLLELAVSSAEMYVQMSIWVLRIRYIGKLGNSFFKYFRSRTDYWNLWSSSGDMFTQTAMTYLHIRVCHYLVTWKLNQFGKTRQYCIEWSSVLRFEIHIHPGCFVSLFTP